MKNLNMTHLTPLLKKLADIAQEEAKAISDRDAAKATIKAILEDGRVDASERSRLAESRHTVEVSPAILRKLREDGSDIVEALSSGFQTVCSEWGRCVRDYRDREQGRLRDALEPFYEGDSSSLGRTVSTIWIPVFNRAARMGVSVPHLPEGTLADHVNSFQNIILCMERHSKEVGVQIK